MTVAYTVCKTVSHSKCIQCKMQVYFQKERKICYHVTHVSITYQLNCSQNMCLESTFISGHSFSISFLFFLKTSILLLLLLFHGTNFWYLFLFLVLSFTEEALLSNCQNLPNPDQGVVLSSSWEHHPSHASLQKGRACHRGRQTVPQPRTWTGIQ